MKYRKDRLAILAVGAVIVMVVVVWFISVVTNELSILAEPASPDAQILALAIFFGLLFSGRGK